MDLREAADGRIVRTLFEPEEAREECSAMFAPPGDEAVYVSSRVKGTLRFPLAADAGEPVVFDAEPGFLLAGMGGGRFVLTHRADGRVKVVDERGRVVTSIAPHPQAFAAALSSDGRWLATQVTGVGPSAALSARVWSLPGGELERTIDCGPTGVVAFSEDSSWLAVSGRKGVELLRGANGKSATASWPESVRRQGKLLSFTADGSLLAVEVNEAVVLLRPATGEVLATLRSPSGEASFARVRLSHDGRRLAMMWDNAAVDVWQLDVLRRELRELGLDW